MFLIRSTFVRTLIGLGLGTFAIGCGGPEEEAPVQQEEAIGTVEAAGCTDVGAVNYTAALGSNPGDKVSSTSGVPYNNTQCPTYYVVEATQTYGKKVSVSAAWVDSSVRDSETRCKAARLEATVYGAALFSGWVKVKSVTVAGSWDPVFNCSFMWTPSVEVASFDPTRYTAIRVAAKAYINTIYGPYYFPVNGTIAIPEEPPYIP